MLLLAPENDYASSGTSFLASSPLIKCNSLKSDAIVEKILNLYEKSRN